MGKKKVPLGEVLIVVLIVVTTLVGCYGGCKLYDEWKRTSKESKVRTDLEPLKKELLELKTRVSVLEKKCQQQKTKEEE